MLCTVKNIHCDYLILFTSYPQDDKSLLTVILYNLLINNKFFYRVFACWALLFQCLWRYYLYLHMLTNMWIGNGFLYVVRYQLTIFLPKKAIINEVITGVLWGLVFGKNVYKVLKMNSLLNNLTRASNLSR